MKIHEYQAKELFREYSIPIPSGRMITHEDEAEGVCAQFGFPCVVKAQVHCGGRGKAGGIKLVKDDLEYQSAVKNILGMKLVSNQTGPEGKIVRKVLIEEGANIKKELYLSIIVDREKKMPVIIASTQGGMEIEVVAHDNPELIIREYVHPVLGLSAFNNRKVAFGLGLNKVQQKSFIKTLKNLYHLFISKDASLVEINPLIINSDDELVAIDGKIDFDDNALYRHQDIVELRDKDEEHSLEVAASEFDLNYIKLEGSIGCMVNGAGLAMATMDIIKYFGGEPANFLDVGGGTSEDRVKEAFKILMSDKNVKAVFVNIFGGIVRTDVVANGIVNGLKDIEINIPIVIRLVGTNEEEGRRIIEESGMDFIVETDLKKAAQKIVEVAKGE